MTDETQASGPERPRPDRLAIAPEAKNPVYDYQWFAMSIHGTSRAEDSDRRTKDGGWIPVARTDMPAEISGHDEFIQRAELRLFYRLRAMSDKASLADIEMALAPIRHIERVMRWDGRGSVPGNIGTTPPPPPYYDPLPRKTRIEKHKRGRLLVIHEATLPKKWRILAHRHQYAAQWLRIVYLPRDESEMANRTGMSYADWGWAKTDLYREGHIGKIMVPRHRRARKTFR